MSEVYPGEQGVPTYDEVAAKVFELWSAGVPLTQHEADILVEAHPEIINKLNETGANNAA